MGIFISIHTSYILVFLNTFLFKYAVTRLYPAFLFPFLFPCFFLFFFSSQGRKINGDRWRDLLTRDERLRYTS